MRRVGLGLLMVVVGSMAVGCGQVGVVPQAPPSASTSGFAPSEEPGVTAPHNAENNGWKRRHKLSADEQRAGDALAARIRPKLAALRSDGNATPEATKTALLGLDLEPDRLTVEAFRAALDLGAPPPGAVFAVEFGAQGCVIGDVDPGRLSIEVTGTAPEFGCLEPYSH